VYSYNAKITKIIKGDLFEFVIDLGFGVSIKKRLQLAGVVVADNNSNILLEREIAAKSIARARYTLENRSIIIKTILEDDIKVVVYESEREMQADQSYNLKLIQDCLANPYYGDNNV
jgi:hypothetical protein